MPWHETIATHTYTPPGKLYPTGTPISAHGVWIPQVFGVLGRQDWPLVQCNLWVTAPHLANGTVPSLASVSPLESRR